MARESKPFRDRNPVVIGAVSLTVIALLVFARVQRAVLPLIGGGTVYKAAVHRGGRPAGRTTGAGRRGQGRQGREPRAGGRRGHGRVPGQGRLRRRPLRGRDQDRDGARRQVPRARARAAPASSTPTSAIPLERTASPYDVVEAFGDLSTTIEEIDTEQLAQSPSRCWPTTFADTPARCGRRSRGWPGCRTPSPRATPQLRAAARRRPGRSPQVLADRNGEFTQLIIDGTCCSPRCRSAASRSTRSSTSTAGAGRAALRPGRRQPRGAHARRCSSCPRSPTSCSATRRPGADGEQPGAVRPGVHQHPGQRPLVRQLRQRPAARRSSARRSAPAPTTPLPVQLARRGPDERHPAARRRARRRARAPRRAGLDVLRPAGQYRVTAYFTETVGLYPGSDVRVLGIAVGDDHRRRRRWATGCGWR